MADVVDKWCERAVLALVLAVLVFSPLALGSVRLSEFLVVEWLTLAILLVWSLRFIINPRHRLLWPPVNWAVLAFVGYAVVRYACADIEYVARQELMRVLVYAVLFFAIVHNLHRKEATQMLVFVLLGLGMVLAMYGLYQHLTNSNHVWWFLRPAGYLKRGSGTFYCPNHLAGYLELLLPLAIAGTLIARLKPLARVFTGYAAFVIFGGIISTVSRGGWFTTGVVILLLVLWLLQQRGHWLPAILSAAILLGLGAVFVSKTSLSPQRIERLFQGHQLDDFRFPIWQTAARMWQDNFWFGVGPAHFNYRYAQYRAEDVRLQAIPDRVHNDYLNALADWGLVGTLLVAAVFAVFFWQVARSWRFLQRTQSDLGIRRSNRSAIVIGGTIGLAGILVHSIIDFNLQIPANAILTVTLLAIVTGHFRFASERYWHTVRWPLQVPVAVLLAAGIGFFAWQSWRTSLETYWLAQARKVPYASDAQLDRLKRAFAADPANPETSYRIGETLRRRSFGMAADYQPLAEEAVKWFKASAHVNPYDPLPLLGAGMALDWISQPGEAEPMFEQARRIDPNGWLTRTLTGWHYFQIGDYEKALEWINSAFKLKNDASNPIGWSYFRLSHERLAEQRRLQRSP